MDSLLTYLCEGSLTRAVEAGAQLPTGSRDILSLALSDNSGIVGPHEFILKGPNRFFMRRLKATYFEGIEWNQVYLSLKPFEKSG